MELANPLGLRSRDAILLREMYRYNDVSGLLFWDGYRNPSSTCY